MISSVFIADRFGDTPTDFDAFVAREHGVASEQAAALIASWMLNYQSPAKARDLGQAGNPSQLSDCS